MTKEKETPFRSVARDALKEGLYRATYENGQTFEFDFGRFFPGFADMSEVQRGGIINGFRQKLDDCQADAGGDVGFALGRVQDVCDALNDGRWTVREPGEGGGGSLVVRTFMKMNDCSYADAKERWQELVGKNMAKNPKMSERAVGNAIRAHLLANNPTFKAAYESLRTERESRKTGLDIDIDI